MKLFVVPPHHDVTLTAEPPAGWRLVHAARAFAERVLEPSQLLRKADELERGDPSAPTALTLRGAAALLERRVSVHSYLRACGAAFAALSAQGSAARLRLDDLELDEGTTERSRDVLAAAAGTAPYDPDLDAAADACADASLVRLWLDRDQVLPGAVALARRLSPRVQLELAGPFADAHRSALGRISTLAAARHVRDEPPAWTIVGPPGLPLGPIRWRAAGADVPRDVPWVGRASLDELCDPDSLRDCRTAVTRVCAVGDEALDADGRRVDRAWVAEGVRRLRARDTTVVGEWVVGAPGIGEDALRASLEHLDALFDWVAGFRRFELPNDGAAGWSDLRLEPAPPGHDLARHRRFSARGTLGPQEVDAVIQRLAAELGSRWRPSAGAVAATTLERPPAMEKDGALLALDPDCAVFPAGARTGDGGWCALNVRTGATLLVDRRLGPALAELRRPQWPDEALPSARPAARERLVEQLLARQIVVRCGR